MTILVVKVTAQASHHSFVSWDQKMLRVRLKAAPEKGQANAALLIYLSRMLGIPRQAIEMTRGHTSRVKYLKIDGVSREALSERIEKSLSLESHQK
ncbi:MAG TPA: DUF167 domain-containing protein [Parachlamydiales bacterium]|nr:MAG: hypothetical protein A3E26_02860 [Chlamydiae bacterium RIFCSPHIGHO2_12_FULL_49_32]OGN71319.1 MAG: hypothetical protein A3I15_00935 [Chlamydiae bacterium RIFCSPLOWO2_02_FULL_49_12]HAZ16130.1 DUF167 domain-containing protein [Parachlamydiales bacterium]HCJ82842.1 DUF167 domain-containing protein [Parachlamydiales bacterium]